MGMDDLANTYDILGKNPESKRPLRTSGQSHLKDVYENVDWT